MKIDVKMLKNYQTKFNSIWKNRSQPSRVYAKNSALTFADIQHPSIVKIYNKIGIHRYLLNMVNSGCTSAPRSVFCVCLMGKPCSCFCQRRSQGCPVSSTLSRCGESVHQSNRQEKAIRGIKPEKEVIKLFVLADNKIWYVETPKEPVEKLL